ncbi:MAG: hypothetical protein AAF211_29310, partial [Myxococcota bacterium]
EFGHSLGFAHEQNRPDKPASCVDDPAGPNGTELLGYFDRDSIMNYCSTSTQLSDGDKLGVVSVYGGPFPGWSACSSALPCPTRVGDCEDGQCFGDARCVEDVGAMFDWSTTVDVCLEPGDMDFPGWDFCRDEAVACDGHVGDCDSDAECRDGGKCVHNVGDLFGWASGVDVCVQLGERDLPFPGTNRCTPSSRCHSWVGACSTDADCVHGRCLKNVGDVFGWSWWMDVCVADGDMPYPGDGYCRPSRPCHSDVGGCDDDDDCFSGTVCDLGAGAEYGYPASAGVCTDRFPRVLVRRDGLDPTDSSLVRANCIAAGTGEHPDSLSISTDGSVGTATPFGDGGHVFCRENTYLHVTCELPGHTGEIAIVRNGVPRTTCTGPVCSDAISVQPQDQITCRFDDGSLIDVQLERTGDFTGDPFFDMSGTCSSGAWVSIDEDGLPTGKTLQCPAGDDITVVCTKWNTNDAITLSLNGTVLDSEGPGAVASATQPVVAGDVYTCHYLDN